MRKTTLLYFLGVFVLTITGCGVVSNKITQTSTSSPCLVFVSSHPEWPGVPCPSDNLPLPTSTIDKNDPETWPLFEYSELGFSMKLPFESNAVNMGSFACSNKVDNVFTYIYQDCASSSRQDYTYYASINFPDGSIGDYLGSISAKYVNGDREVMFGWLKDFYRQGNNYVMGKLIFHPIEIITIQNVPLVLYDANKVFGLGHPAYGVIFNLPANKNSDKNFKATAIQFYEDDLPLEQFIMAVKTIKFFSSSTM